MVLTSLAKEISHDLSDVPRNTHVLICDTDNKKIFTVHGTRVIKDLDDDPKFFAIYIGEEIFLEDKR